MAEAGCRAALVGYGADEIFRGYRELAPAFLAALAGRGRLGDAVRFVRGARDFLQAPPRRIIAQALDYARVRSRAAVIRAQREVICGSGSSWSTSGTRESFGPAHPRRYPRRAGATSGLPCLIRWPILSWLVTR